MGGVGAGGEARQSGTPHTLTCLPPLPPLLACLQHTTERSITLAIAKKDPEAGYWPRLLKEAGSRAKNIKVCVWVWGGGDTRSSHPHSAPNLTPALPPM